MKEFRSTEEDSFTHPGLKEYLQGLPRNSYSINCPNLRVLPEDVKLINPDRPSETYKAGTLICIYRVTKELGKVCEVRSELKIKDGELEFICAEEIIKFRAKLVKSAKA